MFGSPLVVPFWDNFWNLSDRALVPTHSVLSAQWWTASTPPSEVVFVTSCQRAAANWLQLSRGADMVTERESGADIVPCYSLRLPRCVSTIPVVVRLAERAI